MKTLIKEEQGWLYKDKMDLKVKKKITRDRDKVI